MNKNKNKGNNLIKIKLKSLNQAMIN